MDPISNSTFCLAKKPSTVSLAHSLNMTVFYYFLSNEFNAYAFDYRSDPILQINSVISNYNIDGFITDFPATLYNFLHSKCFGPGVRVHVVVIEVDCLIGSVMVMGYLYLNGTHLGVAPRTDTEKE